MMKNIGMVRQVDELGRIVIPIELRRVLGVDEKDAVEFFIDEEAKYLMFRKLVSGCLFCGSIEALSYFKGQLICSSCMRDIRCPKPHLAEFESAVALESEIMLQEKKMGEELRNINTPTAQWVKPGSGVVLENEVKLQEEKKRRGKQEDTRKRLAEVMRAHPNATQVELAGMLGVTQSYVSYLIRSSKKANSEE
ncbi:transcriptional pleiotropic regulator of transition state genes [Paenibacillus rhizosphaerae]|uniref:Transcriptional pleiotropic regulator of transition state genes n=1 Tax=Paenibacillus rhizosphaerae TaxID=297318 RepID=A0A839TMW7_9BACL|nr:transcriptional pleiotropic regulator of transition state genes [Paenibacillus rhizosphaerae]